MTSPTPDEAAELTTAAEIIASDYAHDEPSAELPSAARAILDAYEGVLAERDALRADLAQARAREQAVRDLADRWRAVPAITRDRVEDADELIRDLIDNVSAALPASPQEGDNRG